MAALNAARAVNCLPRIVAGTVWVPHGARRPGSRGHPDRSGPIMIVLHTVSEVREHLNDQRAAGRTVGMVGTTGSLHEGHLSLVRRAKAENDVAVMFWSGGLDLEWAKGSSPSYSPDMERDLALVEANGLDVFFSLNRADLYAEPSSTFISLPSFAEAPGRLEDPEHLKIVATMVTTFCNIAGPCRTYFGEKDWQQLAMLQKMVQDLYLPYEVVACPTVRESDGVATSSRNQKLTPEDRLAAPILYQGLQAAADAVAAGVLDAERGGGGLHCDGRKGRTDRLREGGRCTDPDAIERNSR